MTHEGRVEKAASRRKPRTPLATSQAELRGSPRRLIARIDSKRGDNSFGAALRAGALVRQMRREAGLSQKELGDSLGVSQARISEIEAGAGAQGPTWALMERVALACNRELGLAPVAQKYPGLINAHTALSQDSKSVFVEVSAVDETYGATVIHGRPTFVQQLDIEGFGGKLISEFVNLGPGRATRAHLGSLGPGVRTRLSDTSDE